MTRLLFLLAFAALALPMAACNGTNPALVVRSPIGFQMESTPNPMRLTPGYSSARWSAPRMLPQAVPFATPGCP